MKISCLLLPLSLLFVSPSVAADIYMPVTAEAKPVEANGWVFTVAPYFWMAGVRRLGAIRCSDCEHRAKLQRHHQ